MVVGSPLASDDPDYDDEHGHYYLRGLETELPQEAKVHRRLLKLIARKEVMKSQYLQHAQHGSLLYPQVLAQAYQQKSQQSVELAIAAGRQDQAVANRIYDESCVCGSTSSYRIQ
jgi:hypothetical protein